MLLTLYHTIYKPTGQAWSHLRWSEEPESSVRFGELAFMKITGIKNTIRDTKNFSKRYDWKQIQLYYDAGNSWRDVIKEFGMTNSAVAKAVKRGDLKMRTTSEASKLAFKKYGPNRMGKEARKQLSIEQSTYNRGGKSKWYEVSGQKVQGTWERNVAEKFNELGIKWVRPKLDLAAWPYVLNGKLSRYTPDFYLPDLNLFLEIKGHWWGDDKNKMKAVIKQHSDKQILIIEKEQYNQLLKGILPF